MSSCRATNANVNGSHAESGSWGPDREQRRQDATRATAAAREVAVQMPALRLARGASEARVSVDATTLDVVIEWTPAAHATPEMERAVMGGALRDPTWARLMPEFARTVRAAREAQERV